MKTLRVLVGCVLVVLALGVGIWQYNRHVVTSYVRSLLAQSFHVPQDKVTIQRVQELGFWRDKLNPIAPHSWAVDFTVPNEPNQPGGTAYTCTIEEPSFGRFKFPGIPYASPSMPAKP